MEPVLIAKENMPTMLMVVGHDIEKVIDTFTVGYCEYYDVVKELYSGHRQLWILPMEDFKIQGWMITKIQTLATGKRLIFDLFGGKDLDLIFTHFDLIEAWAKKNGATEMFAYMRPGLRKKLKKFGFRHVCDIAIRPLK